MGDIIAYGFKIFKKNCEQISTRNLFRSNLSIVIFYFNIIFILNNLPLIFESCVSSQGIHRF
jgi:hypothetical protein